MGVFGLGGCGGESVGASAVVVCSLERPAPPDSRLRAVGTELRDGLGRVVILRGVNAGRRSKFTPYVPFDYAEGHFDEALGKYMDRANSRGIDVLRVPFVWAAVEPVKGQDDEELLKRYDALLDAGG